MQIEARGYLTETDVRKSHFSSILLIYLIWFYTCMHSILEVLYFFSGTENFQASYYFPFFAFRIKYILDEFENLEEKQRCFV